jgi:glycine/serine hydroxymethyltransferase
MKKVMMAAVMSVACVASVARADFYEYTGTVTTNAAVLSDALPVSGTIDRIEVIQTATRTNAIVVATYSGSTAVDTFVNLTALTDTTKVIRPRFVGTTTAGVALTAAALTDTGTNLVGTALIAPYEKPIVGGNLRVSLTSPAGAGENSSTVTVRFYFDRNKD